jgi:hypothetical protein
MERARLNEICVNVASQLAVIAIIVSMYELNVLRVWTKQAGEWQGVAERMGRRRRNGESEGAERRRPMCAEAGDSTSDAAEWEIAMGRLV